MHITREKIVFSRNSEYQNFNESRNASYVSAFDLLQTSNEVGVCWNGNDTVQPYLSNF